MANDNIEEGHDDLPAKKLSYNDVVDLVEGMIAYECQHNFDDPDFNEEEFNLVNYGSYTGKDGETCFLITTVDGDDYVVSVKPHNIKQLKPTIVKTSNPKVFRLVQPKRPESV